MFSNPIQIVAPKNMGFHEGIKFANEIRQLSGSRRYELSFHKTKWFEPFAMMVVATEIQNLRKKPKTYVNVIGDKSSEAYKYASYMGFLSHSGVSHLLRKVQLNGSNTHLPIKKEDCQSIVNAAKRTATAVGLQAQRVARDASKVVIQNEGSLRKTVEFTLTEVIRNVIEHSNSPSFSYCAQYWSAKNKVELCILDEGIGIPKSLAGNKRIEIRNDYDALRLSLLPGLSCAEYFIDTDDVWSNSGFGLYMTSRLWGEKGSFFVASGDASLLYDRKPRKFDWSFSGTAIRLVLDVGSQEELKAHLEYIRNEGQSKAKEIAAKLGEAPGASLRASVLIEGT